jgi:TatD family-associated radical SAM protein
LESQRDKRRPRRAANMNAQKTTIVYRYGSGLYVNLTNRCPTACSFCVKNSWKMDYRGSDLDLRGAEPAAGEVAALAAAEWAAAPFEELVFCGYGEPTMRLDALLDCARLVRAGKAAPVPPGIRIRVNTNGLANAVWGRDVVPEMKGLVDSVHVSMNTADPLQWEALMRPMRPWAEGAFGKVKDFIREAARLLPETFVTVVEGNGVDIDRFKALAAELGAKPRVRARLDGEDAG